MWSLWPLYFNTFILQFPIPSSLSVPHKLPVFVFTRRNDIRSTVNAYKSNWPREQSYYYQQLILKIWSFSYDLLKKLLTNYPFFFSASALNHSDVTNDPRRFAANLRSRPNCRRWKNDKRSFLERKSKV